MRFTTRHDADMAFGWARHHEHEHERSWQGGPFGEREHERHGPGGRRRGSPMFGRGDLKFALLELLTDQPQHGYEMIKALEERSGGFYTPSAGAIYPTLQMMEDIGWATSQTVAGKKVYTLTEAGKQALQEHNAAPADQYAQRREHHHDAHAGPPNGPHLGPPHERERSYRGPGPHASPELHALHDESKAIEHLMRAAVRASRGDPAVVTQLQGILGQARDALNQVLNHLATQLPYTPPQTPQDASATESDPAADIM
jgi:DNA-binding PadR family transcriptional regulator